MKAVKGFPADPEVWHIHPIGLVGNFANALASDGKIAWGAKVPPEFKQKIIAICEKLKVNPSYLMACMAWETGETFSPSIQNKASGATGLIQFMPSTAAIYGTTVALLAAMSGVEQLDYAYKYFESYTGRLNELEDVYAVIFWPAAVGKPDDY